MRSAPKLRAMSAMAIWSSERAKSIWVSGREDGARPAAGRARGSRSFHRRDREARTFLGARGPAGGDGLGLGVEAEGVGAVLVEVAEGRELPAAEGVVGERHRDRHVDADHADIDAGGEIAGGVAVAGEDRRAVAVGVRHGELERLFVGFGAHGGEDGAEDLFAVDVHVGGDVVEEAGADEEAVLVALHREAAAVDREGGAGLHAGFDEAEDFGLGRLGDDGAEIDVLAGGVGADLEGLDAGDELFDQRVGGGLAHGDGDRDRHAALAGRTVAGADQRIDGLVEIGVGHDDHVVLGAAEALDAFAVRAAAAVDVLRDRRGADEADGGDLGMVEDGVDGFLVAVHDLEDAVGQAGFLHQLGEHQRHGGVALGGLEDEGVAAGDGRAHLPHRDHRREVEGRDAGGDAERLAHRIHVDAGAGGVGEFALQEMRRADAEFGDLKAAHHVAAGVRQGLAVLAGEGLGELVHVAVEECYELHHHPRPALRVGGAPGGLGGGGRAHGGVELGGGGQCHPGLNLAGGGIEDLGAAARCAGNALAVDEVADLVHELSPGFGFAGP